jgi:hypothetical protein
MKTKSWRVWMLSLTAPFTGRCGEQPEARVNTSLRPNTRTYIPTVSHGKAIANRGVGEGVPNHCIPTELQCAGQYLSGHEDAPRWWFSRGGGAFQPPPRLPPHAPAA